MGTENKAVLISIQPKWCELIASGKKTVEVRKTKPAIKTPFKCYIYCTLQGCNELFKDTLNESIAKWNEEKWGTKKGNVIGEFVCDRIDIIDIIDDPVMTYIRVNQLNQHPDICITAETCLNINQLQRYLNDKKGYGWHISDLKIYDEPKELSEFEGLRKTKFGYEPIEIKKAPQSWCYVEEGESL